MTSENGENFIIYPSRGESEGREVGWSEDTDSIGFSVENSNCRVGW